MSLRFAFVGFRHGHILSLYKLLRQRDDAEIVAACEKDESTRAKLGQEGVPIIAGYAKKDDLRCFLREICGAEYVHLPCLAPTPELLDAFKKGKVP